jgi:hypothetical protein
MSGTTENVFKTHLRNSARAYRKGDREDIQKPVFRIALTVDARAPF